MPPEIRYTKDSEEFLDTVRGIPADSLFSRLK